MKRISLTLKVSDTLGSVSTELVEPEEMKAMLVFAHGAGAGMHHRFMIMMSEELAKLHIGTMRFNFLYMEKGKKRPDPPAIAEKTIEAMLQKAFELYPTTPILAAGKSFGGRMSSNYLSKHKPTFMKGIVFLGFPLHAAGQPSIDRASHLAELDIPMLFLQGTKDALAKIDLIEKVCATLPKATLIKFEGADHSFKIGKREVGDELAVTINRWLTQLQMA